MCPLCVMQSLLSSHSHLLPQIVTIFKHVSIFSEGSLGDHVNVRRPFPPASEELMSRSYHGGLDQRQRDTGTRDMMRQSVMAGTEIKTIEHSLALIRSHVKVTLVK